MSWKATAYVKESVRGITAAERALLFTLADSHDTTRRIAWPSLQTLAENTEMPTRTVQRLLRKLQEKGFIRQIRPAKQGRGATCWYEFPALDGGEKRGDKLSPFSEQPGCELPVDAVVENKQKGDKRATEGRHPEQERVTEGCQSEQPALNGSRARPVNRLKPEPVLGNPNCSRCFGTGWHPSIVTPGRQVQCECVGPP